MRQNRDKFDDSKDRNAIQAFVPFHWPGHYAEYGQQFGIDLIVYDEDNKAQFGIESVSKAAWVSGPFPYPDATVFENHRNRFGLRPKDQLIVLSADRSRFLQISTTDVLRCPCPENRWEIDRDGIRKSNFVIPKVMLSEHVVSDTIIAYAQAQALQWRAYQLSAVYSDVGPLGFVAIHMAQGFAIAEYKKKTIGKACLIGGRLYTDVDCENKPGWLLEKEEFPEQYEIADELFRGKIARDERYNHFYFRVTDVTDTLRGQLIEQAKSILAISGVVIP